MDWSPEDWERVPYKLPLLSESPPPPPAARSLGEVGGVREEEEEACTASILSSYLHPQKAGLQTEPTGTACGMGVGRTPKPASGTSRSLLRRNQAGSRVAFRLCWALGGVIADLHAKFSRMWTRGGQGREGPSCRDGRRRKSTWWPPCWHGPGPESRVHRARRGGEQEQELFKK